jgi:hypothetical protein
MTSEPLHHPAHAAPNTGAFRCSCIEVIDRHGCTTRRLSPSCPVHAGRWGGAGSERAAGSEQSAPS